MRWQCGVGCHCATCSTLHALFLTSFRDDAFVPLDAMAPTVGGCYSKFCGISSGGLDAVD